MGREESGESSAYLNSSEGRAPEGQRYAGGPRTPRRGYATALGCKADSSTGKEAGPESGLKLKRTAGFIEPMLLLRSNELPDGPEWLWELKVDGYRAVAVKSDGRVHLRSRNDNDFSSKYPAIRTRSLSCPMKLYLYTPPCSDSVRSKLKIRRVICL
jgi:hypothetical protein